MTAPAPIDYPVRATLAVTGVPELRAALCAASREQPVRITGTGSRQDRLPAPPVAATVVSLRGLRAVQRLEPDDLTCSVEPGLTRAELDRQLDAAGLCLPCAGGGTLGGLFAAGDHAPLAPGAFAPRALLLGLEGMLGDGTSFRCGARVVKSVAGFDLAKLFVGSRGSLFVATLLHLKLRPRPRAVARFRGDGLGHDEALAQWRRLRLLPMPPVALFLERRAGSFCVRGRFESTPRMTGELARGLELPPGDEGGLSVDAGAGMESVAGFVRPSRVAALFALLPAAAHVVVSGTGQFEAALAADATDVVCAGLPELEASGEIRAGAPARRGRATPGDAGAERLMRGLKQALDPTNVLA